jgi:hypothetical protein
MNRWSFVVIPLWFALATACFFVACGSSETPSTNEGAGPSAGPNEGFGSGSGGSPEVFANFVITPTNATVTVDFQQAFPTTEFSAKGIRQDGSEVVLSGGSWSFSRIDAAAFKDKTLVPTGFVGGRGQVVFKYNGQTAKTNATIKLRISAGVPPSPEVVGAFETATMDDGAIKLVYPYDRTVFPRGLPTPIVQWTGGAVSNLYRITAQSESFDFVGWATINPPGRYAFPTMPADIWAKLTDSTVGSVNVSVARWDGTKAYKAKSTTWMIAPGNLKGTIYYTRLTGNEATGGSFIRRVQPGKPAESFLEQKPQTKCIACHSISRDGTRLVASVNGFASPWATYDTNTGKELFRSGQASGFQAISPTGSHVLWRHFSGFSGGVYPSEGELRLSTFDSDAVLSVMKPPGATPTNAPGHPVWSPDGSKIAFAMRAGPDGLTFTSSSLWVVDVSLNPPSFSNYAKVIDPTAPLAATSFPTFSPDAKWIAFIRANRSRSDLPGGLSELWMASVDGKTVMRLDAANGIPDLGDAPKVSWGPNMSPIASGGYFWLAFFSRRPFGNMLDGKRGQIWIAAVDANPTPGKDSSHPAFYVTGQDTDSSNERPQFTSNPCKPKGDTCENGFDCCDGYCRKGDNGDLVCHGTPSTCASDGEKCLQGGDCCEGLQCIGGFCNAETPR